MPLSRAVDKEWVIIDEQTGQLYKCWSKKCPVLLTERSGQINIVLEDLVTTEPNVTMLFEAVQLLRDWKRKHRS